jgi:alpha-tubulin suppressor-like RCC1 family protein
MGAGNSNYGQLGGRRRQNIRTPQVVSSGARSAAGGGKFSLVSVGDGSVWAMGSNQYGQLPGAGRQDSLSPVRIFAAPSAAYP